MAAPRGPAHQQESGTRAGTGYSRQRRPQSGGKSESCWGRHGSCCEGSNDLPKLRGPRPALPSIFMVDIHSDGRRWHLAIGWIAFEIHAAAYSVWNSGRVLISCCLGLRRLMSACRPAAAHKWTSPEVAEGPIAEIREIVRARVGALVGYRAVSSAVMRGLLEPPHRRIYLATGSVISNIEP